MSGKIFNTRVKNKRDSVSNWTDKNPILLDGEVVVVDSTDGESLFNDVSSGSSTNYVYGGSV